MNNAENVVVMAPVITDENNKKYVYHMVKRTFDIMVALIACLFLLPLSIIVKVVSLLSGDTHSIFYKQKRVGKDGKLFYIYKFRSMVPNADELLEQTLKMDKIAADEWKNYQKITNDPRITKIGKFLRKTSLDELPQFINCQ